MKHVFIISELKIYKGNSAGAARMMNIAKALANEEIQVYLCSTALNKNISIDKLEKIYSNIFLVGKEIDKRLGKLRKKLLHLINFFIILRYFHNLIKLSNNLKGEKVYYIYPTLSLSVDLLSLLYLKYFYNNKIFYEVNELRRSYLLNRLFSANVLKRFFDVFYYHLDFIKFYVMEKLTKYYDGLIVISRNIENYFKKYNKNFLRMPILSDITEFSYVEAPDHNKDEMFSICFAGMISLKKEGFDNFYNALSHVKSEFKNIELHLYGLIMNREKDLLLNYLPLKYGLKENIFYHGSVEQSLLLGKIRENHLLILPRPLNLQTHFGFSTKLSEYLVSGIPVLVTDVSDNSLYIIDGYNGFIVKPGDYKDMAEKIKYIILNYNKIKGPVGKNAYLTAKKHFYYMNYSSKISEFLFPSK